MLLLRDGSPVGTARFCLSEFLSSRVHRINYLRYFDLNTVHDRLLYGLNVTMSLASGQEMDVTRLSLSEHQGLYLPPPDYYDPTPLPHEWIHIFSQLQDHCCTPLPTLANRRLSSRESSLERARPPVNQHRRIIRLIH